MPPHLRVDDVVVGYRGGPAILRDVTFTVRRGEVVAILGRNGAGKTTLLRAISGLLNLRKGRIEFEGVNLKGRPAHEIARRGIGHVPEGRRVFPGMTVTDNLRLGGYGTRNRVELKRRLDEVFEMLPMLGHWRTRVAGTLSGGQQQLLSIARSLMGAPSLILLDEPLTGLAPAARHQVLDVLQQIRRSGKTVVIVEQNVVETLPVADYALVIDMGSVALEGPAERLMRDPTIQEKYLGITVGGGQQ